MTFRLLPFLLLHALFTPVICVAQEQTEISPWKVEVAPDSGGKYKIKGSVFGIGDPVHEILTLKALQDSGVLPAQIDRSNSIYAQVLRGVFWNDDPCAQLFSENNFSPLKPSMGVAWYLDFASAKSSVDPTTTFSALTCPMLGASHFGNLQFLHGMANAENLPAADTAKLILAWLSITYRVATGELGATTMLNTDSEAEELPQAITDLSPMTLFRAKSSAECRYRALGALLHTIQDSYAHGHVTRARNASSEGIQMFLSYAGQSAKKHAHDDGWVGGTTDLEKTINIPGAADALKASTEMARLYRNNVRWAVVRPYLLNGPLKLLLNARLSGPGEYK